MICKLIGWLLIDNLIWLFCGKWCLVILRFVIILIWVVIVNVRCCGGGIILYRMLLDLMWILNLFLNGLKWMLLVWFLMVSKSIMFSSLWIGVFFVSLVILVRLIGLLFDNIDVVCLSFLLDFNCLMMFLIFLLFLE